MNDNPVELAEEAVAYRLIADALYARSKELAVRAAAAHGRGTLFPKLPDGTELAQFTVPADAETVDVDVDLLLPFVRQYYPEHLMQTVRPAFVELVRQSSKAAKVACGPNGEADIPGVVYWEKPGSPRITPREAGKARAQAVLDGVVDAALSTFARPALEVGHGPQIVRQEGVPDTDGRPGRPVADARESTGTAGVPVRQAQEGHMASDQQAATEVTP